MTRSSTLAVFRWPIVTLSLMIWLIETSRMESSEICVAISIARLMAAWYRSPSAARFCSASRPLADTIASAIAAAEAQISRIL
jgi:hypothetical protein